MLIRTFILTVLISFGIDLQAQSLIGMGKSDVESVMQNDYPGFHVDKSVVKQAFNYLKFVNNAQTITWIIYFSDQDIATSTKKVCDYTEYDFVLDELNEEYEEVDDMKWEYSYNNVSYVLTLEELDWYFTVRERKKE